MRSAALRFGAGRAARRGGRDLGAREPEASGDRVGVLEQGLSLGGQREAAGASLKQPCTDLAFELGDLSGDRRLRQRELTGGTGEGALVRHHTEGEHPPRIHRQELSDSKTII